MFSNNSWAPQNVGPRAIARFAPPLSRPWVRYMPFNAYRKGYAISSLMRTEMGTLYAI